ncbi:unnamed protein product [Diatraea saccharalis]|uniref:UDP-glucuronosyltransferase n=1 Tax=Diatraea saccharalis TaxID=40085 RepID=A0A9N9WJI6_9NEOP|nr:unnamed protein product [Diatraea saccharalis]
MSWLPWLMCGVMVVACANTEQSKLKVLVLFPFPSKSHSILGDGVVRHLIKAGHEVTYITPYVKKGLTPKLRQIDVSDNFKAIDMEQLNLKTIIMNKGVSFSIFDFFETTLNIFNMTFHNDNVQKLLRDPKEKFDVIIAEWMFNELYATFSAVFGAPYIWVSTVQPHWMVLRLIDEASNPAYTADSHSPSVPPFSFYERVQQLFFQIVGITVQKFFFDPKIEAVYDDLAPIIKQRGSEVPKFDELKYNASLMLGNSHVSMGSSPALPQSYKVVGGYHIDTNVKPLPADLQKIMDDAKDGVIYFSMGSNLRSKDLPSEVTQSLLKVFSSLKQTVMWKFEEVLPGLPENVHILKWASQHSILAHPNCKLFITHGGLLSSTETIYFAKPIIGIPVFADQFVNVDRAVKVGIAKRVDLSFTMADELKAAIEEMLNNPSYTRKVEELSFVYHHRPVSPGAELVHWVEHVARTRGAPHLRSPALHVPLYQKMYLDLAAVVFIILIAITKLIKRLFRKKNTEKKKKKTN